MTAFKTLNMLAAIVAAICCAGAALAAESATPTKTAPAKSLPNPTIDASVTEWVVFVADVANPEFNARNLFHDTLPQFVEDLRSSPTADKDSAAQPGPIGLIRFVADGAAAKDVAVDVQLSYKNGRALGHWPRAKVRSGGLLWQDLKLDATGEPRRMPDGSWLANLRDGGGLPIRSGATRESFLLYDVELAYPLAMQVTAGKDGNYSVAHGMDAPLRDLTFYKHASDNHWQTATLASLTKASGYPSTPAVAAAPTADAKGATGVTGAVVGVLAPVRIGRAVLAGRGKPAAAASAAPAVTPAPGSKVKGTDVALGPATETDATVLAPWRAKLVAAGVPAADQEIVLKVLARQALDSSRLTAIYRMDPAELDRILPLEVVPQPKKVSRIALVVVTGIDPAIGDELDQLVKKLGDPVWKNREAAAKRIKKLGVRAKSRLEEAAKDKDTEIAYRAEQLLAGLSHDANQPNEEVTDALK